MKRVPIKEKTLLNELGIKVKAIESSNAITVDYGLEENPTPANLRWLAKITYVRNLNNITVKKLSETPPFNTISYGQLHRWSAEDNWTAEREKYRNKIERQLLNKLSTTHVESIVKQLEKVDKLAERMHVILDQECVAPKSYEGMVSALMKLEEFRFSTREKIANILTNQIQEIDDTEDETLLEKVTTPKVTNLSNEGLRALAHALIKMDKKERKSNEDKQE